MATFKFGRRINIHWNGYDIVGPAETVFSIPDQLYEEFNADIAPVEPTLVWIDTNEFETLKNDVPNYSVIGTSPISIAQSTSTSGQLVKTWSLDANYATDTHLHTGTYQPSGNYSTSTHDHAGLYQAAGTYVTNVISGNNISSSGTTSITIGVNSGSSNSGYLLSADGSGGAIWVPASTSGINSVVGVSPISSTVSGGTVSVSLTANYQTAGTYVTGVTGTAPVSASGTTSISISLNQDSVTAAVLAAYVKNSSGATIAKGTPVYISGSDGANALISVSSASSEVRSSKTLGIVANTLTNNALGYVIQDGLLSGIDTSAASAGQTAWLGASEGNIVFGAPPAEPNHSVYLGVVTKANVSTGEIQVKVQNGYELDELHDVSVGTPTNLDILQYKSSSGLWTKASLSNAGIQPSGTYVNAVVGTSPASVSTATGTATVSIVAGSIDSTHLSANSVGASQIIDASVGSAELASNAVVAAKIAAAAVDTSKINSGTATSSTVLTANGSGSASFLPVAAGISLISSQTISTGVSTVAKPDNAKIAFVRLIAGGNGGNAFAAVATLYSNKAAGGNAGSRIEGWFNASIFSSTVSYSIGGGGSGASSASYTSATMPSASSGTRSGTRGGDTTFGVLTARQNAYGVFNIPYLGRGSGDPDEGDGGSTGAGTKGTYSGGGGGVSLSANTSTSGAGDGGSLIDSTVNYAIAQFFATSTNSLGGGGGAGSGSAGATGSGTNGSNGSSGTGGGGGGTKTSSVALTADVSSGNGGNGGYPGGGGGGGGVIQFSATSIINTRTVTSGSGGSGGGGQIYIEWWG